MTQETCSTPGGHNMKSISAVIVWCTAALFSAATVPAEEITQADLLTIVRTQAEQIKKLQQEVAELKKAYGRRTGPTRDESIQRIVTTEVAEQLRESAADTLAEEDSAPFGDIDIHGFISQGYMKSTDNNYLTLNSNDGSVEWHEAAINFSKQFTEDLRGGLQLYMRNIGDMGNYNVELDWAYGDYNWRDWLGLRIGKVKTPLGLYSDVQDLEFLNTWILLPQSVYPVGQRSLQLAHIGADLYGEIPLSTFGSLAYQGYVGTRELDKYGGFFMNQSDKDQPIDDLDINQLAGFDLTWETPLNDFILGWSYYMDDYIMKGHYSPTHTTKPAYQDWIKETREPRTINQFYTQYTLGDFRFDAEFRRVLKEEKNVINSSDAHQDQRGGYGALTYRFTDFWAASIYYSRFYKDYYSYDMNRSSRKHRSDPSNLMKDWCLTTLFDINTFWNIKMEAHFIDGYSRGMFELRSNPNGLKESWNLFAIKTSFNF